MLEAIHWRPNEKEPYVRLLLCTDCEEVYAVVPLRLVAGDACPRCAGVTRDEDAVIRAANAYGRR